MSDCPHEHEHDTGFQDFRNIIREETDGGRDLVRFFTNAMSDERYMFKDEPWNYMYTVYSKTLEDHTFATDGHDPFIYDSDLGRYVPANDRLRNTLADSMKHEWSPARVDLILAWYRDRSPRLWDTPTIDRVNVLNGIFDLDTRQLEPHSPDFLSPIQINAAWDPEAQCPAIDQFVRDVFPDDAKDIFYQLAGLFLTPDSRFRKAVLFLGPSAVGKSLALTLLRTFLDPRNVSNVPLHDLTEGSFALPELRGKLLNISADVPERDFNDTAIFKQIVDGHLATLRAPRKFRDPIEFQPFTRLIASANRVPQSSDNSLGYFRRWLVVPFDTEFKDRDFDHTLLDRLTTPQELSGLLNRAVEGYYSILSGNVIKQSAIIDEAQREFDLLSDPTRLFFDENVQECSFDEHVDRTELYGAYKTWCDDHRFSPVSARRFYNSVWDVFRVETFRTSRSRLFKGIRLVPDEEPEGSLS